MNDALDVEDAEQRLSRLQTTLHKLNATSSSKPSAPNFSFLNKEAALEPPKELLLRVHAFLPAIQASNARLASQDPEKIDIEHIEDNTGQYIEMNLGLGLFDVRGSTAPMSISAPFPVSSSTSTWTPSSYSSTSSSFSSTSMSSSDDNDSDSESDAEIITSFVPIRPTKPLPRRAARHSHPHIVVLDQTASMSNPGTGNGKGG